MNEENKKVCKKIIDSSCFYIIVSIAIILYLIYIVVPYGEKGNLFSEGHSPNASELTIYRLMIWPIFAIYLYMVLKKMKTFNIYIKPLIYPLTEITFFTFLISLCTGSAGWILFFIFPIFPVLLVVDIIVLAKAIDEWVVNTRKKQQNKQLQEKNSKK